MKKKKFFMAMISAAAVLLSACQSTPQGGAGDVAEIVRESGRGKAAEQDGDALVWRVACAGGFSEEEADEVCAGWQNAVNAVLQEKGAGYSVRIEAFAGEDESSEESVQTADELEKLKESGEQTDLISLMPAVLHYPGLAGYHLVYPACAGKGLLLPLDELLKGEKGQELRGVIPSKDLERAKIDGTTYGVSTVLPVTGAALYSKEKMKKYGVTAEELEGSVFDKESLLVKIRDLSGEAPYGIHSGDIRQELGLWILEPTGNVALNQEGVFVNVTETDEFREYLERLVDWKKKGLVEVLGKPENSRQKMKFVQNGGTNYRKEPYEATLDVSVGYQEEKGASVLVVPDETRPVLQPYWGDYKICIASWTENREKAEDFLVRLMTDADIANSIQYGKEGQDYTLDGDIVQMKPEANIVQHHFGYQYTNQMITHSTAVMAADKLSYTEAFHESYGKEIPDGFRFDPTPVLEQILAADQVFDDMDGTETARKIVNLEIDDVDQVIAAVTEELKRAGIDEVAAEANRQLEAWRKRNR
ncbi:DUF3502 domain-containing protein [Lachnospiraceae bacterium 46-15]